jgi:hypothetical protein
MLKLKKMLLLHRHAALSLTLKLELLLLLPHKHAALSLNAAPAGESCMLLTMRTPL